jgi:hypothetical protein
MEEGWCRAAGAPGLAIEAKDEFVCLAALDVRLSALLPLYPNVSMLQILFRTKVS